MVEEALDTREVAGEPISPELVLVTPELAEIARARLPDPPSSVLDWTPPARVRPAPREGVGPIPIDEIGPIPRALEEEPPPPPARRSRLKIALGAALLVGLLAAGVVIALKLGVRPDRAQTLAGTETGVTVEAKVLTPGEEQVLSWNSVDGAGYYDVRLFRGDARILDLWPSSAHVTLPADWVYGGIHYQLDPGVYRWYVYPGNGDPSQLDLGELRATGVFVVPQS